MEHGISFEGRVTRVIDGDTVEIEVRRKFHLRLRNIDCPEKRTPEGKKATKYVEKLIGECDVDVFIPSNKQESLMDINSFNRLLGDLYVPELKEDLATILKAKGYVKDATKDY